MSETDHDYVHRAIGALVGSAVGDALGAPFEFEPGGTYRRRFPDPVLGGIGEMVGGGPWEPGEFTDDTQMAVMVAESLLACGRASTRSTWASGSGPGSHSHPKDVGLTTRAVLHGRPTRSTAAAEHFVENRNSSAGNGSLMRTIPAAL